MVLDGQPGPALDRIGDFTFSLDGKHFAYAAGDGESHFTVLDGRCGPAFDVNFIGSLALSYNGQHLAFRAKIGGDEEVVLDGKAGPLYDWTGAPLFSPDGTRLAYTAAHLGDQFVVENDKPGPAFDKIIIGGPTFHSNGVLEYLAVRGDCAVSGDEYGGK